MNASCSIRPIPRRRTPSSSIRSASVSPELVGLSFLSTTSYPYAKILARQIRAVDSKVKLAFGGVFATLNAPLVKLQCPEVDFVCRGDGEQLILDLLEQLEDPVAVAGLTWARDGKVVNNPNRPAERDLDQWPFPDRESLAARLHRVDAAGCAGGAFDGAFHHDADLARMPVALRLLRHPDLQPGQMAFAQSRSTWSPNSIICRSTATARCTLSTIISCCSPSGSKRSARGSVDSGVTIQWGCEGRVDSVAQHLFPAMAKAHCRTLMFGIESGSQKILDRLKKEQTLEEVETAVTNAKQAGIEIVHGFFVVGNPDETVDDLRATFDFAVKASARHL